ncbi:C40 family peptidase [Streptomyces sp. TRM70308]|uniref:C40 family peptidase n=1 Tax=Streptomyces sp. TRM70308 TaxID=3131932 RepID=UPI003CFF9572
MSNAHIRSHRKPRRSSRNTLIRSGVAGGVLTTLAVTGAASPSSADDQASPGDTVELPTLDGLISSGTARAAQATQTIAIRYDVAAAQDQAAEAAQEAAARAKKKARERAEREAAEEAERKAEEAAARARAEERAEQERAEQRRTASRSAERPEVATTSEAATPAPAPAGGSASAIVDFVRAQVGKAYVMGSTGPSAYDCSGLTSAAYKQVGVSLPRTSQAQSTTGTDVPLSQVQPGDILYWGGKGSAYHVAIYVGGGKFVGAQNSGTGVVERDMSWDPPSGAVRVL